MEISEIQTAKGVAQLQKKEGICQAPCTDRLSISSESEKKALWVEMLKQMPEVRPEKIEVACSTIPSNQELAEKIMAAPHM